MKKPTIEDERKLFEAYETLDRLLNNHSLINDLCKEKINKVFNEVRVIIRGIEEKQTIKADDGLLEIYSTRGACMVICSECGKHKKHLEKKIGKLYTNTLVHDFVQGYKNDISGAEIKTFRNINKLKKTYKK